MCSIRSAVFVCLLGLWLPAGMSPVQADLLEDREKVQAALRILNRWHESRPEPGERYLHLVCWTPSDREFPADDAVRLTRIMEHIRAFYEREMEQYGMPGRTIRLQYTDHLVRLHRVRGLHPTSHYDVASGREIRRECLPVLSEAGINADEETIFILCNLADWNPEQLKFTHKSPYYAGGSFQRGTAWQLDSPELDTLNLPLKEPRISDGQYGRISLGKHNSIFIGGMAHELGHALGLPHCTARPDESVRGEALMGSGNRTYGDELRNEGKGSFLTVAHALRLASHPQFSGSVKGIREKAVVDMKDLRITRKGKAIHVSGTVSGSPPVYAMVAYFDPEGGSDYDATTATSVPDDEGRFSIESDALRRGKRGELRLFPLHANGSAAGQMSDTPFRYSYSVASDGVPDVSNIETRLELSPLVNALIRNDQDAAEKLAAELRSEKARAIAARLLIDRQSSQTPDDYTGTEQSIPLTDFKPSHAEVGWGRVAFDRIPGTLLLESAATFFDTGIYAHAPAKHIYRVGGKWTSVSGQVGLATGHKGTVVFEVRGDGQSLWKSDVVESAHLVDFQVSLEGVQELELLTHTTDDGGGADWGLWLAPVLNGPQF